jgi:hypothetical protein
MISMMGYILLAETAGVLSASIGFPMVLFVIIHFLILRPSGIGWTPLFECDVYYSLVALMFSVVGWLFGWGTGLRDAFWYKFHGEPEYRRVLRILKAAAVLVTIAIGVVAFELLPDIKDHVGGEVGGAILLFFFDMVAIWLVFFLLFRQWGSPWLNDRAYDFDPDRDLHDDHPLCGHTPVLDPILRRVALAVLDRVHHIRVRDHRGHHRHRGRVVAAQAEDGRGMQAGGRTRHVRGTADC